MLSTIFTDFGEAISYVLNINNWVMLLAMLVISLFTGIRMGNYGHVFGAMMESTLLLGLFYYFWSWLSTPQAFSVDVWESETIMAWNNLMTMTGKVLVGYLATFFILVSAVYLIKAVANRD